LQIQLMEFYAYLLLSVLVNNTNLSQFKHTYKSITEKELFKEFPYIKKRYLWGGKFWSGSSFISTVGSVSLEVGEFIYGKI